MAQAKSALTFLAFTFLTGVPGWAAETVSFLVDPATIDANMDGFITGTEFSPIGSDGVQFTFRPTNNLTGSDRFQLSDTLGLRYGGGGGSTLSFDFSADRDFTLETYTITDDNTVVGNPLFELRDGSVVISTGNPGERVTGTRGFTSGPLQLTAGTTYTFQVTNGSAATQSYLNAFGYSVTAIPGCVLPLGLIGAFSTLRRRRR
ncbi:MAG: hypothetical protein AAFX06_13485 [Planctomycetota bacterium]